MSPPSPGHIKKVFSYLLRLGPPEMEMDTVNDEENAREDHVGDTAPDMAFLRELIVLGAISAILAGISYYWRTEYVEGWTGTQHLLFRTLRVTLVYLVLPMGWLHVRHSIPWKDVGIRREGLGVSLVGGILVYGIALMTFIWLIGDPHFDSHFTNQYVDANALDMVVDLTLVGWMVFLFDVWTRGILLLLSDRAAGPRVAILIQNLAWFTTHLYEIEILAGSPQLGWYGAIGLTLVLGLLGDLVVLRCRNVIGMGVGHFMFNAFFAVYVAMVI